MATLQEQVIANWKTDPNIRNRYRSVADYYDDIVSGGGFSLTDRISFIWDNLPDNERAKFGGFYRFVSYYKTALGGGVPSVEEVIGRPLPAAHPGV